MTDRQTAAAIYAGRPGGAAHSAGAARAATRSEEQQARAQAEPPARSEFWGKDVLDWPTVPAAVRDKCLGFRDVRSDRHAQLIRVSEELGFERDALVRAEQRIVQLQQNELRLDDDRPSMLQANEMVRRHKAAVARLTRRVEELGEVWNAAAGLVDNNVERYLRTVAPNGVRLHEVVAQLRNGETALDGLDRAARRTRELVEDRKAIQASPYPTSVAKKRAREQIALRAAAAKPDVYGLVELGEALEFPFSREPLQSFGTPGALNIVDPVGLLAWMFPKEFAAAIDKEIDAAGDDKAALTDEQRREKLAQIDADLLASQREEAQFAELAGLLPRPYIDPRAALGLADDMPAQKAIG